MHRTLGICLAALAFSTHAHAGVYLGNPNLGFHAEAAPGVELVDSVAHVTSVEIQYCDGHTMVYSLDAHYNLTEGGDVDVDGGDLCSATIHWATPVEGFAIDQTGPFDFSVQVSSTTVELQGNEQQSFLSPEQDLVITLD